MHHKMDEPLTISILQEEFDGFIIRKRWISMRELILETSNLRVKLGNVLIRLLMQLIQLKLQLKLETDITRAIVSICQKIEGTEVLMNQNKILQWIAPISQDSHK